jgi:chromosome segregation ATPase
LTLWQEANSRIADLEVKVTTADHSAHLGQEERHHLQLRVDQMLEDHRFDKERVYSDLNAVRKRADELQTQLSERDTQVAELQAARALAETSVDPLKAEVRRARHGTRRPDSERRSPS